MIFGLFFFLIFPFSAQADACDPADLHRVLAVFDAPAYSLKTENFEAIKTEAVSHRAEILENQKKTKKSFPALLIAGDEKTKLGRIAKELEGRGVRIFFSDQMLNASGGGAACFSINDDWSSTGESFRLNQMAISLRKSKFNTKQFWIDLRHEKEHAFLQIARDEKHEPTVLDALFVAKNDNFLPQSSHLDKAYGKELSAEESFTYANDFLLQVTRNNFLETTLWFEQPQNTKGKISFRSILNSAEYEQFFVLYKKILFSQFEMIDALMRHYDDFVFSSAIEDGRNLWALQNEKFIYKWVNVPSGLWAHATVSARDSFLKSMIEAQDRYLTAIAEKLFLVDNLYRKAVIRNKFDAIQYKEFMQAINDFEKTAQNINIP